MKRTVPLLITAACGFVLIAAHFSPYTESWGEVTMIWFDILASIAFVLGVGNLLKIHLKKISDRRAGWAYSAITLLAFGATIYVGLVKWGAPPAEKQDAFGEVFIPLALADFPVAYSVEGTIPRKATGGEMPTSVRRQFDQGQDRIVFRGWMQPDQQTDLSGYKEQLRWKCAVERLAKEARPPESLRGKVAYYIDHEVLAFKGWMTEKDKAALLKLGDSQPWTEAVERLHKATQTLYSVSLTFVPPGFDAAAAQRISEAIKLVESKDGTKALGIHGPMSPGERDDLRKQFPVARPMPKGSEARKELLAALVEQGPLDAKQTEAFHATLDTTWTVDELVAAVNTAGLAEEEDKTPCEMFAEQERGVTNINPKKPKGKDQRLGDAQVAVLEQFAAGDDRMVDALEVPAPTDKQEAAIGAFFGKIPTEAEHKKDLCLALMRAGPITEVQREYLLADYRDQLAWQTAVGELYALAHTEKFPWSGEYRAAGTPFWWLYEYTFKPLTATMFAMLAFYVASAAFRAFRAKNVEATLLLATAFIILLGRTFAGAVLTGWLPAWLDGLRIDSLTVTIMAVFNTAGTRAIMIGIALGIASISLRVLLGIDRSYLGSGED